MTLKPLYEMLSSIAVIVMLWLMYKAFVWVQKLFIEPMSVNTVLLPTLISLLFIARTGWIAPP